MGCAHAQRLSTQCRSERVITVDSTESVSKLCCTLLPFRAEVMLCPRLPWLGGWLWGWLGVAWGWAGLGDGGWCLAWGWVWLSNWAGHLAWGWGCHGRGAARKHVCQTHHAGQSTEDKRALPAKERRVWYSTQARLHVAGFVCFTHVAHGLLTMA